MFTRTQKFLLLGAIAGGYFFYRAASKHVIFNNQNVFIGSERMAELKQQSYTNAQNRVLIGNPLNKKYSKDRKRIIIIGGGLVGASTAYELSKNPKNEVILLERNTEVGKETSYANGTIFCPSLCYPWTSISLFRKVFKSMFESEHPVSITYKLFLEESVGIWFLNALQNLTTAGVEDSARRLIHVAKESMAELDNIKKHVDLSQKVDLSSLGTITLYSSKEKLEADKTVMETKEKFGMKYKILNKDELIKVEPYCATLKNQVEYGIASYEDTNADSFKLTKLLCELAQANGAYIYREAEFQRFVFDRDKKSLTGVVTDQGTLICDAAVIAGGYQSKGIVHKLGHILPMIPAQGYSVTLKTKTHQATPLKHVLVDESGLAHIAPLKNNLRLSGVADIGLVKEFDRSRLDTLVHKGNSILGDMEIDEKSEWVGVRPFSPDDVPIIGKVKGHDQIYINTGHGSKGLTLCLGSARILKSIMDKQATKEIEKDYSLKRFHFF